MTKPLTDEELGELTMAVRGDYLHAIGLDENDRRLERMVAVLVAEVRRGRAAAGLVAKWRETYHVPLSHRRLLCQCADELEAKFGQPAEREGQRDE